jgi:hypothetical protein
MAPTGERRSRTRMTARWPVRLNRVGETLAVEGETKNLSSQGLYCLSEEPFVPGERLECILALSSLDLEEREGAFCLRCYAQVIRVESRNSEARFGLACKIDDFELVVSRIRFGLTS